LRGDDLAKDGAAVVGQDSGLADDHPAFDQVVPAAQLRFGLAIQLQIARDDDKGDFCPIGSGDVRS
jgi:hypothetical protein